MNDTQARALVNKIRDLVDAYGNGSALQLAQAKDRLATALLEAVNQPVEVAGGRRPDLPKPLPHVIVKVGRGFVVAARQIRVLDNDPHFRAETKVVSWKKAYQAWEELVGRKPPPELPQNG